MKLLVIPDTHFSCSACANCCKNWHVELLPDEIDRVTNLVWPAGDPLRSTSVTMKHSRRTYLAHAADHACVFLNRQTNLCRIHAEFGVDAKPLGCRLYPFQIVPTFKEEATIGGRYGCPMIRKNEGAPYADSLPELKELAGRMQLPANLDQAACCFLDREQVDAVCEFAATLIQGFARNDQRAVFLIVLADWLGTLNTDQLDRETLGRAFIELKQATESLLATKRKKPGLVVRMAFRMFLGLHLRRDEDVLDGRAGRIRRMLAMLKLVLGFGGFAGLGVTHPPGKLSAARLFHSNDTPMFELHWRMLANKLLTLQFFGPANANRDLLAGLRSLALLYPLVASTARYSSGNRRYDTIEAQDIDYAVSVIEHSFGRSLVLAQPFARSIEKTLLEPEMFLRIVETI